jgi:hypothetical protein
MMPEKQTMKRILLAAWSVLLIAWVATENGALIFPAAAYTEKGRSMNVRARWQPAGDDAYDVTTEFEVQGRWVKGFALHMQRVRS